MDIFANLGLGLSVALSLENAFYCFLGVLVGTLVGVLPGLGPTATIAILLPLTYSLDPTAAIIMLAGIYYGAQYGSSTTAILINLPGEATSAVTAIDGYQMARQGRAGPALGIAAIGSFVAGTVATFVIALFAPMLASVALEFGPAEYFSLMVLGLISAVVLAHGSVLNSLAMTTFGLLVGLIGTDIHSGVPRFTFGMPNLFDGFSIVGVAVGLFGIAEILRNLEGHTDRSILSGKVTHLLPNRKDLKASGWPIARGTLLGTILGVLPGGGALLSSFASYAVEKRLSRTPQRFGHGAIEGVAGPESANNAGAQTSFIPMLTLGIPSNAVMALLVGGLLIHNIAPGPNVMNHRPDLFWGLIASMWIGNLMLLLLNLPLIGIWVKVVQIPYVVLFPAIIVVATIGTYSIQFNTFDLYAMALFGLLGYVLIKLDCEPTPFLLGFVLGPLLEENLRRAMLFSHGDPSVFITQPISAGLLALACIMLVIVTVPRIARGRQDVFVED